VRGLFPSPDERVPAFSPFSVEKIDSFSLGIGWQDAGTPFALREGVMNKPPEISPNVIVICTTIAFLGLLTLVGFALYLVATYPHA
jgi:hypothetical protein